MRTALLGLIWITACYAPRVPPSGVPCSNNTQECPIGQSCVDGRCVDPGGDTGTADPDKDGVPNSRDNCKDIANLDQANEDDDAFGDACDLCEQISDTGADGDGDQIGNVCDPNPDPARPDTVWLFNGFTSPLSDGLHSEHWTVAGGNAVAMSAGNTASDDEFLVTQFDHQGPLDDFSVTMIVLVQAITGRDDHSVDITIEGVNGEVECELDGSSGELLLSENDSFLAPPRLYGWTTNKQYRFTMTRHGSKYTCEVNGPEGTQTVSGMSNVTPVDGDAVSISTFGATAQFGSVEIIGPKQ